MTAYSVWDEMVYFSWRPIMSYAWSDANERDQEVCKKCRAKKKNERGKYIDPRTGYICIRCAGSGVEPKGYRDSYKRI